MRRTPLTTTLRRACAWSSGPGAPEQRQADDVSEKRPRVVAGGDFDKLNRRRFANGTLRVNGDRLEDGCRREIGQQSAHLLTSRGATRLAESIADA